ncbi:MAG TPA: polysaccharide deacetylase family protein [Mycobacteriales bacterium]|nr:polysaccharide deacetylase family protein [Mycobacteriales bacterium]
MLAPVPVTLAIVTPTSGATVLAAVPLVAALSGAPPGAQVSFSVDGARVGVATSAPYTVIWNTGKHPNGPAVILAKVEDASGHHLHGSPTASVAVVVANTPAARIPLSVTLDFDNGTADQYQVEPILRARGLVGVFFVGSGRIGLDNSYLTLAQIQQLQAAGNEIGGHTVFDLHLPQQSVAEQQRQICTDRAQLLAGDLHVTDLAFPFGEYTAAAQDAARRCGYNTARTGEGAGSGQDSVPPADPYALKVLASLGNGTTLESVIHRITDAQKHSLGLAQLVFHGVCGQPPCRPQAISAAVLTQVLDWLATQQHAGALQVKTVAAALGGGLQPAGPAPAPTATLGVANGSFEQGSLAGGVPTCWEQTEQFVAGGGNDVTWSLVSGGHSGSWAEQLQARRIASGVGLVVAQDEGSCAAPAKVEERYGFALWYRSTAPLYLVAYRRVAQGGYLSFGLSDPFPASPNHWSHASVTTAPLPTGSTGLSVGLVVKDAGTFTVDDATLLDAGPADPAAGPGPNPSVLAVTIPQVAPGSSADRRADASRRRVLLLGAVLLGAVLALLAVDRRLAYIRRSTQSARPGGRPRGRHRPTHGRRPAAP